MRTPGLTAALFFLVTAAIYAAQPSGIRCSALQDPRADFEIDRTPEWRFSPIDAPTFRSVFRVAKKRSYGRFAFFIATKDSGTPDERSTILMIGASVDDRTFFRVVNAAGQWPDFDVRDEKLVDEPKFVRLTNDAAGSLFRVTIQSKYRGHTTTEIETTYIVSVKPQPRIVASINCQEVEGGGGACGAFDFIYSAHDALQCDWSRRLHDFACTSTRAYIDIHWMTHPEERRFTLLGDESLPVTKSGTPSFHSIQELGRRVWTDLALSTQRVMVDGIGLLAPLGYDPLRPVVFAAPGLYDDMELRVFVFPREGAPVAVPLRKIVDSHEAAERPKSPDDEVFTPTGEEWSVAAGEPFALASATVFPIVLHDGKGRGLFWLAIDRTTKPPAMSLLRLAADVGPYDRCKTFIYPASASAVTIAGEHADLTIEPHSRRGEGGEAEKWEDDGDELPCHVRGTVTWDHERGFSVVTSEVPCHPDEVRVGVVIDALGHLSTAPLRYEKDR